MLKIKLVYITIKFIIYINTYISLHNKFYNKFYKTYELLVSKPVSYIESI